jgi:WD40 repeat protein
VTTQALPENIRRDVTAEELAQPRIHLVDMATAEVRETLIAPAAIGAGLCFSPDGRTLASSGQGQVLLWDLSTPPGSGAAPAVEIERHDR